MFAMSTMQTATARAVFASKCVAPSTRDARRARRDAKTTRDGSFATRSRRDATTFGDRARARRRDDGERRLTNARDHFASSNAQADGDEAPLDDRPRGGRRRGASRDTRAYRGCDASR